VANLQGCRHSARPPRRDAWRGRFASVTFAPRRALLDPMNAWSRRGFVARLGLGFGWGLAALGPAGSAAAMEPLRRPGPPRMRLSLAAYSFRQFFRDGGDANADESRRIDLFRFIDYCAEQGCDGAELTSYYFPKNVSSEFLLQVKRHAILRAMDISGTAVGNKFTLPVGEARDEQIADVKRWVDRAALLGAPHIRIFAGDASTGIPRSQARTLCIGAIEECCDYAAGKGVFLGLENHGGIVAEPADLLEIVRAVDRPWFGVNLDTGNFHTDDPYASIVQLAPYAVNVQVKVEMQARGKPKGPADIPRLIRILRDVNYQGYVALEYEAAEDPWKAVPTALRQLREAMAG
jgi:sugar phosphate isomerase/epimerase